MRLEIHCFALFALYSVLFVTVKCGKTSKSATKGSQKSVTVSLNSKWQDTPLLLEAAEYLAEESQDYFWSFIELFHQKYASEGWKAGKPKEEYDTVLSLVQEIVNLPSKISLLKLSLSLRSHSPAVGMFNQIAKEKQKSFQLNENECSAFVEFSSPSNKPLFACDKNSLLDALQTLKSTTEDLTHPFIHKIDHIYPQTHSSSNILILYGEIGTKSFTDLYDVIKEKTKDFSFKFLVRHFVARKSRSKVALSGYGVELAIKSTEYKAQDDTRVKGEKSTLVDSEAEGEDKPDEVEGFIFSTLEKQHPENVAKLNEFRTYLMDSNKEIATLKAWQLQELSLQVAKKIVSSPKEEQLQLLQDISQNFPSFAKSLINVIVDNRLKTEVERNQMLFMQHLNLATTDTALFVNGMYFDMDSTDIFTLLHYLKQEVRLIEGLHKIIGNDATFVKNLLKLEVSGEKNEYQIDIRDSAVVYINDIETDKEYLNWPSSLQDMLRPTYPGMLRNVRRNMFHLVLVVEPGSKSSFDVMKLAESFYIHRAPLRIGFVFAVNPDMTVNGYKDAGVACLNAFNFISEEKTMYEGLSFLTDVIASTEADTKNRDLQADEVIAHFKRKFPKANLELVFGSDSAFDTGRKLSWDFLNRTGIGGPHKALMNGVLLKESHLNGELFEEAVLTEIMRLTPIIQKSIYKGELTDSMNVLDWLMSQKTVMPRLNYRILGSPNSESFSRNLDLSSTVIDTSSAEVDSANLHQSELVSRFHRKLRYLSSSETDCLSVTVWLACNFDTPEGRNILASVVEHLKSNSVNMRLGIIHSSNSLLSSVIETALNTFKTNISVLNFLSKLLSAFDDPKFQLDNVSKLVPSDLVEAFESKLKLIKSDESYLSSHTLFRKNVLKIGENDIAVIVNGKLIEVPKDELFTERDFALIEKQVMLTYGEKIRDQLTSKQTEDVDKCTNLVMAIGNVITSFPQTKTRHEIHSYESKHSVISLDAADPSIPAVDLIAVVEPISRGAQKIAPILITLQQAINANIKVYLNCVDKHSEMPLKNYFRYVIHSSPTFSEKTGELIKPRAHFVSMPSSSLLTLGMVTPDNWLVEAVRCPYDLDNIHLKEVEASGVVADFELAHLLLEGHCFEQSSGNPPRGLQFVLGTNSTPAVFDTIVMANLGYFQLKSNPGAWNLRLRHGRSQDLYTIVSHENTDSAGAHGDVNVVIHSFRSHIVKIRVNKRPGKQHEELLRDEDDIEADAGIWGSLKSWTTGSAKKNETIDDENEKLNIFSVASGHLYERLLRIMVLSVLKHTTSPVKFWFLKNYLSPAFKDFMPVMAQKYGFEYELVEYKWPRWLHQQSEKQRIIWGYKILFLDVLFPLHVKKIIFVDADQVVRTDLAELRELDLEGAPYGYTPFCDSRKEMDGYRFWRSGYWASHLHGRKYHISALYVVDLVKFRRIAAGDRLRGQYQGLSQDPNSLSNLDQDLPNNMIHQVSIKSLPQEWLWCETWCDDKSKKTAKTIDLCNNPKTKEPKLTAARRIVPEWEGYDNEIRKLLDEYHTEKQKSEHKQPSGDKAHVPHSEL
ncbi:UDP-glucose:glycoprotein glucosyltransferase 1-like protein [Leptotrombidium deliense]|uniref:UDP-glucose:glycoprotein glucosyltransferase 1-like protein n=1 Tax=Leptotrombidium deliense TaxID=299467 RepID=A0A443SJB6_9ACAR|nr:UDP-glucose:glycoprotein glucosyltransferase 1-like protein [Leptotrombidium deliense]